MAEVNGLDSETTRTSKMTTDEKIQKAQSLKDEGNEYFKEKDYKNALKKYHRALLHVKGLTDQPELIGITPQEQDVSEELKANIEKIMCSIYSNLSACFVKQERWQKVIDYSTKAIKLQPENAKAIFRRGQAHLYIKDYDNAEKDLKQAHNLEPDACCLKQHQWEKVIQYSTMALEIQPENAKALYRRGKAHLKLEDYEKAEEDLKKAQKLEPDAACVENLLVKLEGLFWWR